MIRVPFRLKSSFSGSRFCVNGYIAKMYTKIACNISSGRYGVRLQVIQSFLKFPYFFTHKAPLNTSFEIRKITLKNTISGLH